MAAARETSGGTAGIRRLALAVRRTQILVGRSRQQPDAEPCVVVPISSRSRPGSDTPTICGCS